MKFKNRYIETPPNVSRYWHDILGSGVLDSDSAEKVAHHKPITIDAFLRV